MRSREEIAAVMRGAEMECTELGNKIITLVPVPVSSSGAEIPIIVVSRAGRKRGAIEADGISLIFLVVVFVHCCHEGK